jgi:hypothetical protein
MDGDPAQKTYPLVLRPRVSTTCEACDSQLLQLEAWREREAGGLTLRLRCAECDVRTVRELDAGEAAQIDDALSQARLEMVALYEAMMRSNIAAEADLLARALALDLIGPDDFIPRRR